MKQSICFHGALGWKQFSPSEIMGSTNQSSSLNISVLDTLLTENRRLPLFGLINKWMGFFNGKPLYHSRLCFLISCSS